MSTSGELEDDHPTERDLDPDPFDWFVDAPPSSTVELAPDPYYVPPGRSE